MRKLTSNLGLLVLYLISFTTLHSQTASFATWKDNKKAAYSIVHDDFSFLASGIYDHAYTLATPLGIKFSFGAVTKECGALEWTKAKTMMAAGHECLNHSHSHKCGGLPADCVGVPTYGVADFPVELDQSTQLIQTNTGVRPTFFVHPYDTYTPAILTYLQNNLGYIGTRGGVSGGINGSNFTDFMKIDYWGFDNSTASIASLNTSVDDAIAQGGYLMREFHGIADPSYAAISVVDYTTHLNYVKTKMDNGSLWSATASEAITYKMQRDAYAISTDYSVSENIIRVNFINTKALNTAILKTPVTVNLDLGSATGNFAVFQNDVPISFTRKGNIISVNVYPHEGNLTFSTPYDIVSLTPTPQSTAVALSWVLPSFFFEEVMIVAKAVSPFTTLPSGTAYTANANFTGSGTAFEGGKVVYKGTGTNVTVTGLSNGTLYQFKAFGRVGNVWSNGVSVTATPGLVPASFANWLGNKKAAYTIIHDDFSNFLTTIYDRAYPIASARGIKFCFGAITNYCGTPEWTKAKTMMAAGYECVNHSHNHLCGGTASQCIGVQTYSVADFTTELDQSTQLIQNNTNVRPTFFIHPYDASSPEIINHLKNNLGYIGTRAGRPGYINSSNFSNFSRIDFWGFDNSAFAISKLKPSVDDAIAQNGYLMQEFHGIEDASSGPISIANYTSLLDYVKTKIADGSIWSATASEAITYKMQRDAYGVATVYNATTGTININFTALSTLNTTILKTPITVNVNLGTLTGTFTATQGTTAISTTKVGNILSFNVYPHQGNVILQTPIIVPQPNNVLNFSAAPQSTAVALSWANPTTNFDEVMIVAKPITAFTTQPAGTTYTADANFLGIGTAFEGGKVVYRGVGTAMIVTGLTNGTLYHFKAFSRLGTVWSTGIALNATPTGTVINPVLGCLKGSYFSNKNLTGSPVLVRAETGIDYNWGAGAPAITGLSINQFSIRWEGIVTPPLTGSYTFTATVDDGVRLWVNDILIINKWIDQPAAAYSASMNLVQGQAVSIRMEYYENAGSASAKLEWTIPTQAKRVIAFNACPINSVFNPALCYRLTARHSNKVMNLLSNATTDGIAVIQSPFVATATDHVWHIKQVDATYYQLVNGFSGKAANIQGASTADVAPLVQGTYTGAAHQLFKFDLNTEGYYTITAKHSNKVLDVSDGSTTNNTPIIQYAPNAYSNQEWKVESVGCPTGTLALVSNRIVAFYGRMENNKGSLNWVVNSEDLKDYYDIEKLDESQNFKRLDVVNGNSFDALRTFYYTDENLVEGENIYRLKSVGSDGSVQISDWVKINYQRPEIYALSPNPTTESVNIDLTAALGKAVHLSLFTPLGKVVKEEKIESVSNPRHTWAFDNLENGQYFLKIEQQGKRLVVKKLVIIK
jgi:peptidoglycan/xylan/chitin deacetylase (PgdA/CDA1 family)